MNSDSSAVENSNFSSDKISNATTTRNSGILRTINENSNSISNIIIYTTNTRSTREVHKSRQTGLLSMPSTNMGKHPLVFSPRVCSTSYHQCCWTFGWFRTRKSPLQTPSVRSTSLCRQVYQWCHQVIINVAGHLVSSMPASTHFKSPSVRCTSLMLTSLPVMPSTNM